MLWLFFFIIIMKNFFCALDWKKLHGSAQFPFKFAFCKGKIALG